jgi:hypothetical protein
MQERLFGATRKRRASRLSAHGRSFCATEDRFDFVQQLLGVVMQRTIFAGQFVSRVFHQFPTAFVKIFALLDQLLTRVDQVIRNFFSLAD